MLGRLALKLANEFGTDFLKEIIREILGETVIATGLSFIPNAGALFGTGLDVIVGVTLTWRAGAIVSAYFQYSGYIGSHPSTYEAIKPESPKSRKTARPACWTTSDARRPDPREAVEVRPRNASPRSASRQTRSDAC